MDLGAYANIEHLGALMLKNNIDVPRLRGLRLMSVEKPVAAEEMNDLIRRIELDTADHLLCMAGPFIECSERTDRLRKKYLVYGDVPWEWNGESGTSMEPVAVRWDRMHGWRRKQMRFALKQARRKVEKQYAMWNRYAGQPNVLYIHARIGAGNWIPNGGPDIARRPWFLDVVEDAYDDTYVDIYAKVKEDDNADHHM